MTMPAVTIVCLCYNQGRFVKEAILSALGQRYPQLELVVVDDASNDDSVAVINALVDQYPQIRFIPLSRNVGNCAAFNTALHEAAGEFVIDLAADDILLPDRVSRGVQAFRDAGDACGVNCTDAEWIAEDGTVLYRHSDRFPHATIPQGDIYKDLIERFFICSPSMMFRRSVIDTLGGYDEALAYEDFDFWIRSSRFSRYCYTPEVLVRKRLVRHAMSQRQFQRGSPQLKSTFRVCEKIMALNRSADEQKALKRRLMYEMTVCMRLLDFPLLFRYMRLYVRNLARRFSA